MHHRSLVFFAAGGVLLALAGHAIAQPATEPLPTEQPDEDAAAPAQPAPAPPARPLPATPPGDAGGPGITVPPGAGQGQGVGGAEPAPRATEPAGEERVFAEDWWTEARPLLELHGYFRLRAELFHNFSLGRVDRPEDALWPMPADNFYRRDAQAFGPQTLCTPDEAGTGSSDDPRGELVPCRNRTQAGANLRFRLAPELHVSGNLRVLSQIDILDNLVLGSTPEGYANDPSADGWAVAERNRYTPVGFTDTTTAAPRTGVNSLRDSIAVKRAWAEYATPVGELRFGRMPAHWGLGILHNSGDGFDDDYQTTIDRLQFVTGVRPLDLYVAGSWDFPNEGQTSEVQGYPQGQPYDVAQLDDVDQYTLAVFRRMSPELERLSLARGNLVLNGGVYLIHRNQTLANDRTGTCDQVEGAAALGCAPGEGGGFVRRGASVWIPDVWVQLRYRKFRFELEAVTVQGSVENISNEQFVDAPGDRDWNISQYGVATKTSSGSASASAGPRAMPTSRASSRVRSPSARRPATTRSRRSGSTRTTAWI
jgi:uncharacterized protein (TIGR04551 family)